MFLVFSFSFFFPFAFCCSHSWPSRLQLTLICDFRAMPSLCRPCAALCGTLVWEPPFAAPSQPLFCGPRNPLFSFVVRAAAANVNSRTRLSHMTPFSGRDWCTRERCRQNPRFSQNSRQMTPRILRRAREFPRIFRESRRLEHTHTAEAWCVTH